MQLDIPSDRVVCSPLPGYSISSYVIFYMFSQFVWEQSSN